MDADTSHSVVTGYITLARVSQAQGDAEGALEALHKVRQVAQSPRLNPRRTDRAERCAEAWQARLWIADGNLRAANRWAQQRELGATEDPDYSSELNALRWPGCSSRRPCMRKRQTSSVG